MGGTGTASASDPLAALFDNPAAMSEIDRMSVSLGVDTGIFHGSFHNRANNDANSLYAGVIGEGAIILPVGPVRFGVGVNPDIASRAEWRYRDATGGADGNTTYGVRRDDHLLDLLSKRIRSLAGVRSTETFVYLKLHKQTYSWGVR